MKAKFIGWIGKWEGPQSFDNAQPELPEKEMNRLIKSYCKITGAKEKGKSDDGQRRVG